MEITFGEYKLKIGRYQDASVRQSVARFDEAVERGNVYAVCNQTTVTTQVGLSATTPALTIANRLNSGKKVKLWYAGCASLVAAGAGAAVWLALGRAHATAVTETTAGTTANLKTGDATAPPGVACLAVATLPAAPVAISVLGAQTTAAITTNPNGFAIGRWYDGAVQIAESCNLSIQTSTASTLFCEFIFEVVDK